MNLITGGAFQGKTAYLKEKEAFWEQEAADETYQTTDQLKESRILLHFHLIVRRWLNEGRDLTELCWIAKEKAWVVTDEIGCGMIPLEKKDRDYREQHGRLCCALAKEASEVYRVVCGIANRIK